MLARELSADVDPDAFEHVAVWDANNEWVETRLRSLKNQTVRVLGSEFLFADGEELRTEISAKFTHKRVTDELTGAGLQLLSWWSDPDGDYALWLATKASLRA